MTQVTWRLGEKGADAVIDANCRILEVIFSGLDKICKAPDCGWPISQLRAVNYEVPDVGEVCATCWDLYSNLTMANRYLKNTMYFRNAHSLWKMRLDAEKKRRERND